MKVRDFSKIFFAILILHLVVIYKPESEILYMLSKPLLLFSLLVFFIHKTTDLSLGGKSWIPAALLSSMIGDILLLSENKNLFLVAVGAFFLAHLFYISFYLNQKLKTNFWLMGLGVLLVISSVGIVYQYARVPADTMIYLCIFTALAGLHLLASFRVISTSEAGTFLPVAGAALLILSDILLIFLQFNGADKYLHIAVMLTYGLAQFFITIGLVYYLEIQGKITERPLV